MKLDYTEAVGALNDVQQIYFYQLFAHFLTVSMRGIVFSEGIPDNERVERAKWLNEIAHRISYKVFALQKNQPGWSNADIWEMIKMNVEKNPATEADVNSAIELSYNYVLENESPAE